MAPCRSVPIPFLGAAAVALLGAVSLPWAARPAATAPGAVASDPCPPASAVLVLDPAGPPGPPAPAGLPGPPPGATTAAAPIPREPSSPDYRGRIRPTPYGWPRRDHWCVWIEPLQGTGADRLWQGRWLAAVEAALDEWHRHLPITVVEDPSRAQVRLRRIRPPLLGEGRRRRASHGRAILELVEVERLGSRRREPRVEVLISPGQRQEGIQATALHELGHAFGLWGHSDHSGDAMAAVPGPMPVLRLSDRDRATLRWLQAQPGLADPLPAARP